MGIVSETACKLMEPLTKETFIRYVVMLRRCMIETPPLKASAYCISVCLLLFAALVTASY